MNIKGHFETITRHKLLVMKYCFECGLYEQGLAHDLSKYSPTEFIPGCIYYQGDHSPNEAERAAKGYTSAWLHHKGRNRHHFEYWTDVSPVTHQYEPLEMPTESFVDGKNKLCVSNEILEEYIEILQRLTDNETAEYVVKTILNSPFVELITPFYHFNLITVDPDDNKFVDCAISANAHYIVTNDHHYDVLKDIDFPKVNIVNIQQFCIYLSQEK
jgi:putative PIN family toxin of toxin-antitoxin system